MIYHVHFCRNKQIQVDHNSPPFWKALNYDLPGAQFCRNKCFPPKVVSYDLPLANKQPCKNEIRKVSNLLYSKTSRQTTRQDFMTKRKKTKKNLWKKWKKAKKDFWETFLLLERACWHSNKKSRKERNKEEEEKRGKQKRTRRKEDKLRIIVWKQKKQKKGFLIVWLFFCQTSPPKCPQTPGKQVISLFFLLSSCLFVGLVATPPPKKKQKTRKKANRHTHTHPKKHKIKKIRKDWENIKLEESHQETPDRS